MTSFMIAPMSFAEVAPVFGDRGGDDPADLILGHLGGQVLLNDRKLGLFLGREVFLSAPFR